MLIPTVTATRNSSSSTVSPVTSTITVTTTIAIVTALCFVLLLLFEPSQLPWLAGWLLWQLLPPAPTNATWLLLLSLAVGSASVTLFLPLGHRNMCRAWIPTDHVAFSMSFNVCLHLISKMGIEQLVAHKSTVVRIKGVNNRLAPRMVLGSSSALYLSVAEVSRYLC